MPAGMDGRCNRRFGKSLTCFGPGWLAEREAEEDETNIARSNDLRKLQ
jgi:hypothetical protein